MRETVLVNGKGDGNMVVTKVIPDCENSPATPDCVKNDMKNAIMTESRPKCMRKARNDGMAEMVPECENRDDMAEVTPDWENGNGDNVAGLMTDCGIEEEKYI